ncbi:MAG: hypothetical protein IPL32_18695 [Chloracidobacterium sp.]|nr:hypothetical protein [Chloracidobacterium sp.]
MNARSQAFPAAPGLRPGSSKGARMAGRPDRRSFGDAPPIEQRRTQGPVAVYSGPDPLALWPARPGIARSRGERLKSHGSLMPVFLAFGCAVFFAGAIRVASHLGYSASPVIVHLLYSM